MPFRPGAAVRGSPGRRRDPAERGPARRCLVCETRRGAAAGPGSSAPASGARRSLGAERTIGAALCGSGLAGAARHGSLASREFRETALPRRAALQQRERKAALRAISERHSTGEKPCRPQLYSQLTSAASRGLTHRTTTRAGHGRGPGPLPAPLRRPEPPRR